MNPTTAIREIVKKHFKVCVMYNDKRANGYRRLKFVCWMPAADKVMYARGLKVHHELKALEGVFAMCEHSAKDRSIFNVIYTRI